MLPETESHDKLQFEPTIAVQPNSVPFVHVVADATEDTNVRADVLVEPDVATRPIDSMFENNVASVTEDPTVRATELDLADKSCMPLAEADIADHSLPAELAEFELARPLCINCNSFAFVLDVDSIEVDSRCSTHLDTL